MLCTNLERTCNTLFSNARRPFPAPAWENAPEYLRDSGRGASEDDGIPCAQLLLREIFQDSNRRRDRARAVRSHRNLPPSAPPYANLHRHPHERRLCQSSRCPPHAAFLLRRREGVPNTASRAGPGSVPWSRHHRRDRKVARPQFGDTITLSDNLPEALASSDEGERQVAEVVRW